MKTVIKETKSQNKTNHKTEKNESFKFFKKKL